MSCQRSGLTQPHTVLATLATLPFLFAAQAWAAPHSSLLRRDSSSTGGGGSSKIVAPIIAALVFLVVVPMLFFRSKLLSKLRHVSLNPMRRRTATTTTVRDLTAEEIAGTAATDQANTASATRTERRARRTRRTPSQISTRSLPAYMKEPGEHELVIIQGSQDMEDAPLTAQVVMPSVEEDSDESSNSHSRNPSQVSSYVIVDDDPHVQTPLLETNESNETTHERENSNLPIPYRTVDIVELRYNDPSSPPSNNFGFADPRGEAPPYFEVVGDPSDARAASEDLARVDTADTLPIAPDTFPASIGGTPPVRRRSMFRGLIDAASRALSTPHPSASAQPVPLSRPSRDMAMTPSPRPSNLSNRPSGAPSPHVGHRPTQSNSGSIFSVTSSAFRTRSRSVTNVAGGLTSPSAISITSISAPLTHTALRTDFVYPRSGPTPEQLKLISSVESVSKFGVPYGPDAVAYASVSLVNLQGPPPEFEERPSSDNLPGSSTAAMRVRPTSGLSRLSQQDGSASESWPSPSISSPQFAFMGTPVTSAAATNETEASVSHPGPILSDGASAPELELSEDKKEQQEEDHPVETVLPRAPSPPTVDTTTATTIVTGATASELSPVPESPDNGTTPVSHRPALPFFGSESMTATATTRNPTAPSSFRMPSTPLGHVHTASRSSSIDTFRTAVSRLEQGRGSERETSDTEHDADSFSDAESGAETGSGTPPATPHVASVSGTVLSPEPPALSV